MEPNPDIAALRTYLRATVDRLLHHQRAAREAGDVVAFERIGLQILEVEHRSRMLGRVEFAAASAALGRKLAPIDAGRADLDAAIADIARFGDFLRTLSRFLGLVDRLVDFLA
jgi:hypothetical protein